MNDHQDHLNKQEVRVMECNITFSSVIVLFRPNFLLPAAHIEKA